MSGLFDYDIERKRHERFVGRAELLDRLDRLLVADGSDRWVAVTGGPGMGKSALLAAWLGRRGAVGAAVPYHFIRRGEYDWDDPAKLVASLVAQLERCFPEQREPEADSRRHPAARLATMLARVSVGELALHGRRLVVMIDGLDEYDPPGKVISRISRGCAVAVTWSSRDRPARIRPSWRHAPRACLPRACWM